jgi:hypothetical protein
MLVALRTSESATTRVRSPALWMPYDYLGNLALPMVEFSFDNVEDYTL